MSLNEEFIMQVKKKLLDLVRDKICFKHYSYSTAPLHPDYALVSEYPLLKLLKNNTTIDKMMILCQNSPSLKPTPTPTRAL